MKNSYETNMALVRVEEACLALKKTIADGSYLKGHTTKPYEKIDMHSVRAQMALLNMAVEDLEAKIAE